MFNVYILYSDPCFSPNQICLKKCRGPLIQRAVSPSVYAFMRRLAAFVVIGRSRQSRSLNDPAHLWGSRKPVLAMFRPSCYQNKRFCWFILSKSIQHIGNDHTPWSELKPGIPISNDQSKLFQGMVTMTKPKHLVGFGWSKSCQCGFWTL